MHLIDEFLIGAQSYPERTALVVDDERFTYQTLLNTALALANAINEGEAGGRVGVFGSDSLLAYAGLLGVLLSGRTYVPLNPRFPSERTASMINRAGLDVLLVDAGAREQCAELLPFVDAPLQWITLASEGSSTTGPPVREVSIPTELVHPVVIQAPSDVQPDDLAYIMFTSGSTGVPKGVMISHYNIVSFLAAVRSIASFEPADRFSQAFDLTFDLSLFDMFVCWRHGAALFVLPPTQRMLPAFFIRKHELTVWFSVPTVTGFLYERKLLRPNSFPHLRQSFFCGEPLPILTTEAWAEAAPNSTLINLYGPTELTVSCTWHQWDPQRSPEIAQKGLVPIGMPLDQMRVLVLDSEDLPVGAGQSGELCMAGPQCCPGYYNDPEQTAMRFPLELNGEKGPWYRTGDRVEIAANGEMNFIGRVDQQVKLQGYRIELGEIEDALREGSKVSLVAAVVWPDNPLKTKVYAFVGGSAVPVEQILTVCKRRLPPYMVPVRVEMLDSMPLNANGKIDKGALKKRCEAEEGDP